MLVTYMKNKKSQLIGTIVATGRDKIGMAICSKKDRFDKSLGKRIAAGRANTGTKPNLVGDSYSDIVEYYYNDMKERARRYFKDVN